MTTVTMCSGKMQPEINIDPGHIVLYYSLVHAILKNKYILTSDIKIFVPKYGVLCAINSTTTVQNHRQINKIMVNFNIS